MKRATFHIEGQRKAALEIGRERLALLLLVFSFAFIGLTFRLFQLTVIEANGAREDVELNIAAPHQVRADILASGGIDIQQLIERDAHFLDMRQVVGAVVHLKERALPFVTRHKIAG